MIKIALKNKLNIIKPKSVSIISFNPFSFRSEILFQYSKISNIPLEVCVDKPEIALSLQKHKNKNIILFDTPGINRKNEELIKGHFDQLKNSLRFLVLAATTKQEDLLQTVESLISFGINRLIFTKIDETDYVGPLLNILFYTKIPLAYVTNGPDLSFDLCDSTFFFEYLWQLIIALNWILKTSE